MKHCDRNHVNNYKTYRMKRIFTLFLVLLAAGRAWSQPLPAKTGHTVIIDTDGAVDDMRAISLLLSRPEITIAAVFVSDGSVTPENGAGKVAALLREFSRDKVPIATGPVLKGINPPWRQFNNQVSWGSNAPYSGGRNTVPELFGNVIGQINEKIILVCLGPLTNIAQSLKDNPGSQKRIEKIIWYNESVKPLKGFNAECDIESAGTVMRSGIRMDVISNLRKEKALFDTAYLSLCKASGTKLADALTHVCSQRPVYEKLLQNHFRLADDLAAIYLLNPELFSINTLTEMINVRYAAGYDLPGVREALSDLITGEYAPVQNIVFGRFPAEREMFRYDIRPIIDTAIALYGMDEWKANVMTDEFHGHLGVFSIVGAKMGIRAREIFGVGPDVLRVVTFAGTKPPYSCLNDGIQVSTGATLGLGLIEVARDSLTRPSAVFSYKDRAIRITLKKEYLDRVEADINEGIMKFGLMDDGYWKLIRHNALKYWLEWDRNKIFDVEEIKK